MLNENPEVISLQIDTSQAESSVTKVTGVIEQLNSTLDAYQEYIMTANGAEAFIPYIFNGTGWDMCI